MAVFGTLARRLWTLVRGRQVDGDVDQDMQLHLALLQQQLLEGGCRPTRRARPRAGDSVTRSGCGISAAMRGDGPSWTTCGAIYGSAFAAWRATPASPPRRR